MTTREELYAALMSGGPHSPDRSEQASARIDAFRTTVLNGTEINPSPLVMDAQAYRWLANEISKTMADGDRWDGDDSEEEILARYVRWLAAEREQVRAEVLREVAVMVAPAAPEVSFFGRYGAQIAAWLNMLADKGKASPAGPTATQRIEYALTGPEYALHGPYLIAARDLREAELVAADEPGSQIVQRTVATTTTPWSKAGDAQ